jgi:malonyl-CoA/methylmalonyl-CoA synthetase
LRSYSTRKTLHPTLVEKFASHGSRTAIISTEEINGHKTRRVSTYTDLERDSTSLKNVIKSILGHSRDPIVLLTPNHYDFATSLTAIWKSGSPAVPLCNTHPPSEWEYYIEDSQSKLYLVHPSYASSMGEIASRKGGTMIVINNLPNAPETHNEARDWTNENALFVYTSGTTGKPKGVVTTHSNIESSVKAMVAAWHWHPSDHILHVLPLHHVHGLVNALITPLSIGATVEMLPKFDAKLVWHRFIQSHQEHISSSLLSHKPKSSGGQTTNQSESNIITVFMAVPSIYMALIKEYDSMIEDKQILCRKSLERLRLMVSGSAALPEPILHRWESISGHRLLERYGMTEIGMALTNPYVDGERKPGSVGKPFPDVEVRIKTDDPYTSMPGSSTDKVIGELYIKGPQVFKEYWRRPKATEETFTKDGWFKTGDSVEHDLIHGTYRILGRKSVDILKTGGFKVSALDIETELLDHPSIHEVAVVGIEDMEWGQIVGAIISLKSEAHDTKFDLKILQEWAKQKMASYKVPRRLIVVPHIPRNAMGKVNKKELVKLFESSL